MSKPKLPKGEKKVQLPVPVKEKYVEALGGRDAAIDFLYVAAVNEGKSKLKE